MVAKCTFILVLSRSIASMDKFIHILRENSSERKEMVLNRILLGFSLRQQNKGRKLRKLKPPPHFHSN